MSEPVIDTAVALDALPVGTVVRTPDGQVWEHSSLGWDCLSEDGTAGAYLSGTVLYQTLPPQATVLYRPDRDLLAEARAEGCRAAYTHVHAGRSDLEDRAREMRPDLIPIDDFGKPLPVPDIEEFEFTLTLKALRQLKDEARAEVQAELDALKARVKLAHSICEDAQMTLERQDAEVMAGVINYTLSPEVYTACHLEIVAMVKDAQKRFDARGY